MAKDIKAIRSDRGGEYLSDSFLDYLRENGILSQLTAPGTPQQNGVAERRNRTLLDMTRSMMSYSELPVPMGFRFGNNIIHTKSCSKQICP